MSTLQSAGDFTRKTLKNWTGTKVQRVSLFSVTEKQRISGFYWGPVEFGIVGRCCRFVSLGRQE